MAVELPDPPDFTFGKFGISVLFAANFGALQRASR
jgi:hypothetical protein